VKRAAMLCHRGNAAFANGAKQPSAAAAAMRPSHPDRCPRGRFLATLLLASLPAGAALRAQERTIVRTVDDRQICSVHAAPYWGAGGSSGLGFLRIEVESHDSEPHQLQVAVWSTWVGDIRVQRTLSLGPEERARFFLPLPSVYGNTTLEVVIDGVAQQDNFSSSRVEVLTGLLIADRSDVLPYGLEVLQAMPSSLPATVAPVQVHCRSADLPADWRLFTGFHVVVVEGRARIGGDVQEALRRFVFGGGTVVVAAADRLPAGALRDLCATADGDEPVAHGLGLCCVIPEFGGDTSRMRARVAELPRAGSGTWPMGQGLCREQPVPGLGRAPILVFLLVILVFSVLVGPVNFLVLRRVRRPMLALVTVPVLGFSTTAMMLGYGLFYDGFGTRGVVTSWTVLDQDRHECAVIAARTLFAGLAPDVCTMGPDTLLVAPRAFRRQDRRGADRWHLGEDAMLDGGVLPSRTATPLLTGQQGTARQRLRVQSVGDRELKILGDGGIAPLGQVVLRDLGGDWWYGTAPSLRRVSASEGEAALQRLLHAPSRLETLDDAGGTMFVNVGSLVARCIGGAGLRPGGYATQVARASWLDEHGLSVAYDAETHFLFGRMQEQDFVR